MLGRITQITDPLGNRTLVEYDVMDRVKKLTEVKDAKNQSTLFGYDKRNRPTSRQDALLKTETAVYNGVNNVTSVTDRKGQSTTYQYDVLDRPSITTYHGGTTSTTYTFDAGNRVTQVVDTVSGTITRTYNGLDLMTNETTPQGSVTYTYDNASRRATMTVAGQTQIVYGFDDADRLTTITQGTSQVTIGYDNASRRTTVTYPNTNSHLTYTYDPAGRRTTIGGTFARATLPPALTTTSYNANNQQLTFGTNTETYDFHGNLATVTDASGTATYTWNVRNQLTGISATGFAASFSYDAFGRRTGKTVQGTTTNFLYDGLNPVQEKNGVTVTANLLTGLNIDEFFTRTDGVGVRALLPDALGSTVALSDNTGTLQTQYTYEPFGFASQTGVASTNSYKYTGREEDGSGLMYYRARYYHPRLQRFIAEDPIGFRGGDVNLYGYVGGNPVNWVDPLGLAGDIPDPNAAKVPGGPWEPRKGMNPGSFQGPKILGGNRNFCEYVPASKDAPEPYWKVNKDGTKGWQRYDQTMTPRAPEEVHPGNPRVPAPIPPIGGLQPLIVFPWQIPFIQNSGGESCSPCS